MQVPRRTHFSLRALAPLLAATALATGCAAVNTQSPRSVLWQARVASARGDYAALYALLPSGARRTETLAQFRARMSAQREELTGFGTALDGSLRAQSPVVNVPSREGGASTVIEENGEGWRLASSGLGDPGASSPEAALTALRRALERQSLPALLRVLSSRARGALIAEMATVLDGVTEPPPMEHTDTDHYTLLLPDGRRLQLVREDSRWRVQDLVEASDTRGRE